METLLDILVARCSNVPHYCTPSIAKIAILEADEYVVSDVALLDSRNAITFF